MRSTIALNAPDICERIGEQLQAFMADSPQWDDITLVVLKVKPAAR